MPFWRLEQSSLTEGLKEWNLSRSKPSEDLSMRPRQTSPSETVCQHCVTHRGEGPRQFCFVPWPGPGDEKPPYSAVAGVGALCDVVGQRGGVTPAERGLSATEGRGRGGGLGGREAALGDFRAAGHAGAGSMSRRVGTYSSDMSAVGQVVRARAQVSIGGGGGDQGDAGEKGDGLHCVLVVGFVS